MQEDEMRKAWCGNCGFKDSETCCSETNWKRCRLMSSEPEGKNVEARLELARSSAREKLLDEVLRLPKGREQPNGEMYIYVNKIEEIRQTKAGEQG